MSQRSELEGIAFFNGLSLSEKKRIEAAASFHHFDSGAMILSAEDENRDVFFLIEGSVRILNYSSSGRYVSFATVNFGNYFGEIAALDGGARSASVVAVEDVKLASIAGDVFVSIIVNNPSASLSVMKKLTTIIRSANDQITGLSFLNARQRVQLELLKLSVLSDEEGPVWKIDPVPTQADLAASLGVARETVSRVISQLLDSNVIEKDTRTSLMIVNRSELERLAIYQ